MINTIDKLLQLMDVLHDKDALEQLVEELYTDDAFFEDPLVRADGLRAIQKMWRSFGAMCSEFHARIQRQLVEDNAVVVEWEMQSKARMWPISVTIPVVSWLEINGQGKIVSHKDYWDVMTAMRRLLPVAKPVEKLLPGALGRGR
ncbi:MAG: nuclear transport factor 2 family protein [Halioglobus sp.]|nr:nuclear transport factor 2 family protein [Halioglobus sp.]